MTTPKASTIALLIWLVVALMAITLAVGFGTHDRFVAHCAAATVLALFVTVLVLFRGLLRVARR